MFIVLSKKSAIAFSLIFVLVLSFFAMVLNEGSISVFSNSSNKDWGLSYQVDGETPVGNASSDFLKQYNSYYAGNPEEKTIYLTFDAGYDKGTCKTVLDTLKKHNVPAAFFLVGNFFDTHPELVKRMADEGHIVGNHTMSHPDMGAISDIESFKKELEGVEEKYGKITGKQMLKVYRPPQGKFSEENLKMANSLGYKTFFWSLAYVDWLENKQPSKEEAFSKLLTRIHPGAIVLLHSTSKTNAEILDELLTRWKEMGYKFGSLSEI